MSTATPKECPADNPTANPAAMDFLLTRRSRPAKMLTAPVPDRAAVSRMLTAAARTPDHGKLEPWRFVVLERPALERLAALATARGTAQGLDAEQTAKGHDQFDRSVLCVAVISSPKPVRKFPQIEQTYSAAAACLGLLNAALAMGWGANWITGWPAHDTGFVTEGLKLEPHERVVGFVHLGTEKSTPPERPRPDLAEIVTWMSE